MSARLYPKAFSALANGTMDWSALTPRAILLSAGFTYNSGLQYRDELDEAFVIAESAIPTTLTWSGGVAGGLPFEWAQLIDNRVGTQIVIFDDTGDDAYSELITYHDSEDVDGLPAVLASEDYFLYPVTPPGGFFELPNLLNGYGAINTYSVAYNLALGEGIGGTVYTLPILIFGRELNVNQRICYLPDQLDKDECGAPVIRSQAQCD